MTLNVEKLHAGATMAQSRPVYLSEDLEMNISYSAEQNGQRRPTYNKKLHSVNPGNIGARDFYLILIFVLI